MLMTLTPEVRRRTLAVPKKPWPGWIGVAVGLAYFLAAKLSLVLLAPDGVALFWPAAGVSAGALIALGRRARLPVIAGTLIAAIAANLQGDRTVWGACSFAVCDAGETVFVAWLIELYLGPVISLGRLRDVAGFLAAAVAATAVSGVGGMAGYKLLHSHALVGPVWTTWLHWFASDAIGMIIVAPLVIGIAQTLRAHPPRQEITEGMAALSVLTVVTAVIVSLPPDPWAMMGLVALGFPALLWIAARCHPVFASAAAFIHSLTIVWAITFGYGHFGDPALSLGGRVLSAQSAIVGFALCAYVLAALFAERRQHEAAIEESEARLQEALTAGAVTAFEWNPRCCKSQRSENAAQILGLAPGKSLSSAEFFSRIHSDDRPAFCARIRRVSVDCPSYTISFRFIRPDGCEVWLEETARGVFDASGRLLRIKGLTCDITRRRRAEERQGLLIAELDHRVKNVLARVAVVSMHTRQSNKTMDDFVRALDGRIQSMAAAHALLSRSHCYGVSLTDLIRRQLAPYATDSNTRINGPDVMLSAIETQALAMVIHELVTNAAKYGALSSPAGRVSVSWEHGDSKILTIMWSECGGPPVAAPVHGSYGSSLIRDLIPHELDGAVDLTFPSEGACCKITFRWSDVSPYQVEQRP